ncbi:MAG: GNAT family N-acetyltransferase [Chloroflexi bacterium]|nr:GNAT family N-acetyltransferase [Chloroflexota bacterium]
MNGILLETERLILRRVTDADFDDLVELDSDQEVTRFITGGIPEFDEAMFQAWLSQYERWPAYGTFAAVERSSGRFLGWFHLRPEDGHDDEPELGYRLRRDASGQGYATEGSRALIDRAFSDLGATRVWAGALAVHTASRRVMEKSGLRFVRAFHGEWPFTIPGDEHGDVEYAITRDEWERDRRPDG